MVGIRILVVLAALVFCTQLVSAEWQGKDCAVDEAIGLSDPNNVYSCKPEETCCTKNLVPACCSSKPMDQVISEQIVLWGTLLGVIFGLGLFIWFCRSDQSLLDAETPCLQKFCPCFGYKRRGDDGHLHIDSDPAQFGSSASLQSKSTVLLTETDQDNDAALIEDNAANLEAVLEPDDEPIPPPEATDQPQETADPESSETPAENPETPEESPA